MPMNNGAGAGGSLISGATGAVLTIQGVTEADNAVYTCVATNGCGSATTNGAALAVCPSDFDCSGGVDGDDVIAFFAAWDAGDAGADVTADGGVDGDDVILFFARWDAGC